MVLAFGIAGSPGRSSAGPTCGGLQGWAVAGGATVPVHPTLAYYRMDTTRVDTMASRRGSAPRFTARLDGRPVPVQVSQVRLGHVMVFNLEVRSTRAGTLTLTCQDGAERESVEYVLDATSKPPPPTATIGRYHTERQMMAISFREGIAVQLDAPALAFAARWRRDAADPWHALELPAVVHDGASTALIGQTECWPDDIPVDVLRRGVELSIAARLPDGRWVPVRGLPARVMLPTPDGAGSVP